MKISHVAWNLAGLAGPLLIAAISIPQLLVIIGNERFGLLALIWGLIGYAGILDFGIGRALTKIIASMLGSNDYENIPSALKTAVQISFKIGLIGAIIICITAVIGATHYLKVESISNSELFFSAILLGIALPLQSMSNVYKGVNEAYLNFRVISIIRVILGVSTFGLPLVISFFTTTMPALVGSLVLSRFFALIFYRYEAEKCLKNINRPKYEFSILIRKQILNFGGWFSVSNILNPILGSLDRILIGSIISGAAIATYAIPYELTVQSLVIVGAITTVTFPYLSTLLRKDQKSANKFFVKIMLLTVFAMLVFTLILYFIGPKILNLWLGTAVSDDSHELVKILSLGLIPYSVGTLCISLIHSYGRTDITAKIHMVEFPFFCILIYYMINIQGLSGAASAWVIRVTCDALLLCVSALMLSNNPIRTTLSE